MLSKQRSISEMGREQKEALLRRLLKEQQRRHAQSSVSGGATPGAEEQPVCAFVCGILSTALDPATVILSDRQRTLTRGAVRERVGSVASHIQREAQDREHPVTVEVGSSLESIIGVMGALLSGRTCLMRRAENEATPRLGFTKATETGASENVWHDVAVVAGVSGKGPQTLGCDGVILQCESWTLDQEAFRRQLELESELRAEQALSVSLNELPWAGIVQSLLTLNAGGKVVIRDAVFGSIDNTKRKNRDLDFSLIFFAGSDAAYDASKYDLVLRGAQLADAYGFKAVWVPERHFHPVGGLFPNPVTLAAALSQVTKQIRLRSGSVVLPLHHPVRVVEDWSVVDNLSAGRVDLGIARGWNPNDFLFSPDNYSKENQILFDSLETVRRLWRGEPCSFPNAHGEPVEVRVFPQPCQRELEFWVAGFGSPERLTEAAQHQCNILTMMINQTLATLQSSIDHYQAELGKIEKRTNEGVFTLLLHTFIDPDLGFVHENVREPFMDYIRTALGLHQQSDKLKGAGHTKKQLEDITEYSYQRYFSANALMGTPDSCTDLANEFKRVGIGEIACQIDFGVETELALKGLEQVKNVAARVNAPVKDRDLGPATRNDTCAVTHELVWRGRNAGVGRSPQVSRWEARDEEPLSVDVIASEGTSTGEDHVPSCEVLDSVAQSLLVRIGTVLKNNEWIPPGERRSMATLQSAGRQDVGRRRQRAWMISRLIRSGVLLSDGDGVGFREFDDDRGSADLPSPWSHSLPEIEEVWCEQLMSPLSAPDPRPLGMLRNAVVDALSSVAVSVIVGLGQRDVRSALDLSGGAWQHAIQSNGDALFGEASWQTTNLESLGEPTLEGSGEGRPEKHDLILGGLLFSQSRNLESAIEWLAHRLHSGGLIVFAEANGSKDWFNLHLGVTAEWWAVSDPERRQHRSALVEWSHLTALCERKGFRIIETDQLTGESQGASPLRCLVAEYTKQNEVGHG